MRISDWSSDVCSSDLLHLVAEQGQAPGAVLVVGGKDVNGVAAHPEGAALEGGIVALVLQLDQLLQQVGAVDVLSGLHLHRHGGVGFRRAAIGSASCRERVWQYV